MLANTYPIIQAPMAGAQDERLTIAVCNAGGIGSLAAAMLSPDVLFESLQRIKKNVHNAPYNVNFFAHTETTVSDQQRQQWLKTLKPYLDKFNIAKENISRQNSRQPFNETFLRVIEKITPPIISFHFGLPEKQLLAAVKATGAAVWASATTIEEAKWLAFQGVDAIIAQGLEAGGHRSMFLSQDLSLQMGTFSLLPNIVKAVNIPVIAAGGISDAHTVKAAFQLGAHAVQVGTAFLLANESTINSTYRQALQSPSAERTVITNLFSGGYARGILTPFMQDVGPIQANALPFPYAGAAIEALKQSDPHYFSPLWSGQNARIARLGSAHDILNNLAALLPT